MAQPYWAFGVNNQKLIFTSQEMRDSLTALFMKVYTSTMRVIFSVEMMYHADTAVADGIRTGNYTSANFLA